VATPPATQAAEPVPPARRAARYGCGGLLVIVIAMVVCGVLVIRQVLGGGQAIQAEALAPITGSVAVLSDGVTIVYSDPDGLCRTEDLTATETPARVMLALSERDSLGRYGCAGFGRPGPVSPAVLVGAMPGGPGYPVKAQLHSPLGHRRLVDAVTGRVVPSIDQDGALRLAPAAGWVPMSVLDDVTTSVPFFGGPGAAVLAENFIGLGPRTRQPDGATLVIVQVAGGGWHPPARTATRKVLVRGRPGLAAPGIIVWPEAGRTIAVIGQGPAPRLPGPPSRAPLPLAALLAIAASLTRG
jgi:hypothetical protein